MKPKELLCIALIAENGNRYDAEVYTDGTFKNQKGEIQKLTPLQFENIKVLQRRSDREKMLIVSANEVVPYREGDEEPTPYKENIAPLTEEDFLLPEERPLPMDMVVPDEGPSEMPTNPTPNAVPDDGAASAKEQETTKPKPKDKKSDSKEKAEANSKNEEADETAKQEPKPPKRKKRLPVILVIILLLLLLCGAGFGIGYMNGYFDLNMLPGVVTEELEQITEQNDKATSEQTATPAPEQQEAVPTPTPTPVPPKTEINLTINAMDGAEVSGSTDVGVNENDATDTEQAPAETESPDNTQPQ